ncbi:MAG: DUF177 domain-containing protein [Desulfonauticus sp.]|nr:DUF177 domain-containing protein [Desulfonauticus sp.]
MFEADAEWLEFVSEFDLKFRLPVPLQMEIKIIPQKKGFYVTGKLGGKAIFECDRCLEDAEIGIDYAFDFFEQINPEEQELLGEPLLRYVDDHFELNIFQIMWEQFLLSLPVKKLCQESCKGLCPKCGHNQNLGECNCSRESGDPRLSIFKQLKINKG